VKRKNTSAEIKKNYQQLTKTIHTDKSGDNDLVRIAKLATKTVLFNQF